MSDQEIDSAIDELAVSTWKYAQMTTEEPSELRLSYWKAHLIHMLLPESSSEHYRLAVVGKKAELPQRWKTYDSEDKAVGYCVGLSDMLDAGFVQEVKGVTD